jgi:signal peptidase I
MISDVECVGGVSMDWKPNRWVAALLSILLTPWGLLYVQRGRLAIGYLVLTSALQIAVLALLFRDVDVTESIGLGVIGWGLTIVAAVHAFRIAEISPATSTRRWFSRWPALVGIPLAFAVTVFLFRAFVFEPFRIPSEAMHPTLPEDSLVAVKKLGYGDYGTFGVTLVRAKPTATVMRGELILFRLTGEPDTVYVKRVIGLPGDRIECRDHGLVINGAPVPRQLGASDGGYQYATEIFDGQPASIALLSDRRGADCDVSVPEEHYFVLGDNREQSRDSRHFGTVPRDNLVGRVAAPIKSPERKQER